MKLQIIANHRTGSTYLWEICSHYINGMGCEHSGSTFINQVEPFMFETMPGGAPKQAWIMQNDVEESLHRWRVAESVVIKNLASQLDKLEQVAPKQYEELYWFEWTNIYLMRKDLFETALSFMYAIESNNWQHSPTRYEWPDQVVEIAPEEVLHAMVRTVKDYKVMLKQPFRRDRIVFYEDLTGDAQTDFAALNLDVEWNRAPYQAQQTKSPPKRNVISNLEEIVHLSGSNWLNILNEISDDITISPAFNVYLKGINEYDPAQILKSSLS